MLFDSRFVHSTLFDRIQLTIQRWMRAMHVDAFFEFCLGHPHPYYTQRPPADALVSDSRDGVPLEEDLALRALVPQWKPKRGRKRAEGREGDEDKPAKRPQLDTSVGVLHGGSFPSHSAFPQSAIPFSAFPDDMESNDPWMTAASSFPADAPDTQQGQDLRWRPLERDTSPVGYPQSAIIPRGHHPADNFLSAEPKSAITPSSGDKTRSRRRHGPAVSSAWPSSNGSSTGKARGRPPNRGTVSGPFSSFPVNPARDNPSNGDSVPRPASAIPLDQNSFGQFSNHQYHSPVQPGGRPGKLQLQVPQHPGGPVRLATPPTLLVNGVDDTSVPKAEEGNQNGPLPGMPNASDAERSEDPSSEKLICLLSNGLLRAKLNGRSTPLEASEARVLAATVVRNLIASSPKQNPALCAAFHLGLGSHFGLQGTTSGTMVVNVEPNKPFTCTIAHEYTSDPDMPTKVVYNNLRLSPTLNNPNNDKPEAPSRATEDTTTTNNSIEDLDGLTDTEFEVDTVENGASDATWKQRYLRLRAQMQKKEKALSQYKRKIMESVMAEV